MESKMYPVIKMEAKHLLLERANETSAVARDEIEMLQT
jgi:hypothetical protein